VARALVRELGCAVLAMRYPVGDDFAIDLAREVYRGVLEQQQTLPRALQRAVPRVARGVDRRPLSLATPALFGRPAADLRLQPPAAQRQGFAVPATGLAHFDRPAPLFVGRVGPLAQAAQALAPGSGRTGVLFYGMAGAGKTACAVELAHHYRDLKRFEAFVEYRAPEEGKDIALALVQLAQVMERRLPGFTMTHVVGRAEAFADWLPELVEFLEQTSLLLLLDNLESLLRPDGSWRDPRWGQLVAALLAHHGDSRTLLTSRLRPRVAIGVPTTGGEGVPGEEDEPSRLLELPIHALSLNEAALLTRQLPNLGRLLRGEGISDGAERARCRGLVVQALRLVQGHPELLKLADRQATDPQALEGQLGRAGAAWSEGGERLEAFFREGTSRLGEDDFLRQLGGWTGMVAGELPKPSQLLFHFLCCLEEEDRQSWIVQPNWPDLWKRLARAGDAPPVAGALAPLEAAGLVEVRRAPQSPGQEGSGREAYRIHPGVAEEGRRQAGADLQAAADTELAAFWMAVYRHGLETEEQGGGPMVVRAGQAAAPYLLRQRRWQEAATMLERVVLRDTSPATLAGVLPLLRRVAEETRGTEQALVHAGVLANALFHAGQRGEAETMMRDVLRQAAEREQFRLASSTAGDLVNLLRTTGRPEEALALVGTMQGYARQAGSGPRTQLGGEVLRLQLLAELGRYEEVLQAVQQRRAEMRQPPEDSGQEEDVHPWQVWEGILDAGQAAALRLGRWEEALALNAENTASAVARGAPRLEVTRVRYNDYGPLLRLGRYAEAQALLQHCREVYEAEEATRELGFLFGALADLEDKLGHPDRAVAHEHTALRYAYLLGDPGACAARHFNLAHSLGRSGGPAGPALAHRLASAMIRSQTASGRLPAALHGLAIHLSHFVGAAPPLPADFAELCRLVEEVEGVRFRELFDRLPKDRAATGDDALRQVLELARALPAGEAGPPAPPDAP
jgi:tetratricopeptide (TPR) repeat protein